MTAVTTEQLSATVGARIAGVDPERLLADEALPAWLLATLDTHGILVLRNLHLDDATQVAFSKRAGRVEIFGKGVHPEIFRITLDPYRHEWAVGDLVVWDNRGVLHRACPYDAASPRDMQRTTLHGEEPIK